MMNVMTVLVEAIPIPDEPPPEMVVYPEKIATRAAEAPVPAALISVNTALAGVWVYIDRKSTRLSGELSRESCYHDSTVMMRFDADELGEWDDIPSRAIVCLGCEAVRWA
jgi:hypothetical protein